MKSAGGTWLRNGSVAEKDNVDSGVDDGGGDVDDGEGGDGGGGGGVDPVPQSLGRRWEGGGWDSGCILQVLFSVSMLMHHILFDQT